LQASATGHGYATEAAECLTRLAFTQSPIERVQIRCDPLNLPSAAIPARLGYRHISTVTGEVVASSGLTRNAMTWEITRRQFGDRSELRRGLMSPSIKDI
jgi:RimJ/RimL family protein N-acetyltransferase